MKPGTPAETDGQLPNLGLKSGCAHPLSALPPGECPANGPCSSAVRRRGRELGGVATKQRAGAADTRDVRRQRGHRTAAGRVPGCRAPCTESPTSHLGGPNACGPSMQDVRKGAGTPQACPSAKMPLEEMPVLRGGGPEPGSGEAATFKDLV